MTITITLSAGSLASITSGPELDKPPYAETLWVSGGALAFDMRTPHRMPTAVIDDITASLMWLPRVYGDTINDALLGLLERSEPDPTVEQSAEVDDAAWEPTQLAASARRIMTAQWLHRWWPSQRVNIPALDEPLLTMERVTLTWQTPLLFDTATTAQEIEQLVPELAVRLEPLVAGLSQQQPGAIVSRREAAVWAAAACASHCLDLETEEFMAIAEAHELRTTPASTSLADDVENLLIHLDSFRAEALRRAEHRSLLPVGERHDYALAADDLPLTEADHYFTVDPIQVPPRSVGGRDDNASVFVDEAANLLQVRVAAGDSPVHLLMARVWPQGDFPLPRMVELRLTPHGYYGETALGDLDPTSCDVFDPRLVSSSRGSVEVQRDLRFIRTVVSDRIDRANTSPPDQQPGGDGEPLAVEEQP